ncbi:hypothetical protein ZWY2020_024141 [Hordeum vulgare]|nr:hypothetical protein ZWY2020_024141 [Hordeum vulgare]
MGPDPAGERLGVASLQHPAVEMVHPDPLARNLICPLHRPEVHRDILDYHPDMEQEGAEGGVVMLVPGGDVENGSVDADGASVHCIDLVSRLREDHEEVLRVVRRDAQRVY